MLPRAQEAVKRELLRRRTSDSAWGAFRRRQLHAQYRARREHYERAAAQLGVVYNEAESIRAIRRRLAARGYMPVQRREGEVHTFAFIPRLGWHSALYGDLEELGPVSEFDYVAHGFHWNDFAGGSRRALERRRQMSALVLTALKRAHSERPVDWIFVYASGMEVTANLLRQVEGEVGVPLVNMCLDDKQSWSGQVFGDQRSGQVDIAATFDLSWTSARIACEWYLVEGARPVYMPEGFDHGIYRPMPFEQDIPVSFIGGAYGYRRAVVRHLGAYGVPLQAFGPGWGKDAVWGEEQVRVLNRSQINLGMGGIGYSESLTNVKTRDFEVPGTGGGVYLTSFNPDLAQHFRVGEEILCYRNRDEMVELIRYYLRHPDEARAIAMRGHRRCLAEHRWLHRYRRVCEILGILQSSEE